MAKFDKLLMAAFLMIGCMYVIKSIQTQMGWPYWSFYAIGLTISFVLYAVNCRLINGYIEKRAPAFASREQLVPGTQLWEVTAGLGIVPRWVSLIGILSVGFLLAIVVEAVRWLIVANS